MTDRKLTALTAVTDVADGDLLYVVDDVAGTPGSKKITGANLKAAAVAGHEAAADPHSGAYATPEYVDQRSRDLNLTPLPLFDVTTATVTNRAVDVIDGVLYGTQNGTEIRRSDDSGDSWTVVVDLGVGGDITAIRDAGDDEILVARMGDGVYKSSGWSTNPATATFSQVQNTTGASYVLAWAIDTNPATGVCIFTEYLAGGDWTDSRKVYLSTDAGDTWTTVYDLATSATDNPNSHMHFASIDPWADDRLWISWHHNTVLADKHLLYSDDLGATWVDFAVEQPTTGTATERGMVFGSDGDDNGIFVVTRTAVPADMTYRWVWEWAEKEAGINGFAYRGFRDPDTGLVYVGFVGYTGRGAVVAASDGVSAAGVWRWGDVATATGDGVRNVMVDGRGYVVGDLREVSGTNRRLRGLRSLRSSSADKIMFGPADFDAVVGSPALGGIGSVRPRRRWSLPTGSSTALVAPFAIPSAWRSVNLTLITAGMGTDVGQVLLIVRWAPVDTGDTLGTPSNLSLHFNPLGSSVVSRTVVPNLTFPTEGHLWVERSGASDANNDAVALLGVMLEPGN